MKRITDGQRFVVYLVVLVVPSILLTFGVGGLSLAVLASAVAFGLIFLTREAWMSEGAQRRRLQFASLGIVYGVANLAVGSKPALGRFMERIAGVLGLGPPQAVTPDVGATLLLGGVILAVVALNWIWRDQTAMRIHPRRMDRDFPELGFRDRLTRFCRVLGMDLRQLDDETYWDETYFTPLDAEVSILQGGGRRRRILDLMTALKRYNRSSTILLIGDPGSGKSVALRKLARELLREVPKTQRVPVYVNLKEWKQDRQWREEDGPTAEDFQRFLQEYVINHTSAYGRDFVTKYFKRLLEHGRLFILLDSFDEIPAVIDAHESSRVIARLSAAISATIEGNPGTRAIVASRPYRRPQLATRSIATLEIRPMTEVKIAQTLSHAMEAAAVNRLFRERQDLIPSARNPFTASLLRLFIAENPGKLPSGQLELYQSHVHNRLKQSAEQLDNRKLTVNQVIDAATAIAWTMFTTPSFGLEAPLSKLKKALPGCPVEDVAHVLRYAKLARIGGSDTERFSFSHRRFAEFFVSQRLIAEPRLVDLEAIPTDSRWREVLALYCEVADDAHATQIAAFCWEQIRTVKDETPSASPDYLRAVHSLRFLRDAFVRRPQAIEPFQEELGEFIRHQVEEGDILYAKIAVEVTGLLPEARMEPVLRDALERGNDWISETALRSCRHLGTVSKEMDWKIREYLWGIPLLRFLRSRHDLLFSLGLSDAFRGVRRYAATRAGEAYLWLASLLWATLLMPAYGIFATVAFVALHATSASQSTERTIPFLPSSRELERIIRAASFILLLFLMAFSIGAYLEGAASDPNGGTSPGSWVVLNPLVSQAFSPLVLTIAFMVLLPPQIPWANLMKALPGLNARRAISACVFWSGTLLAMALIFASLNALGALLDRFRPGIGETVGVLVGIAGGALAITAAFINLFEACREHLHDHRYLNLHCMSDELTRPNIATRFDSLKTKWGRLRYVNWIRKTGGKPTGVWPSRLPDKDDSASTLLAKLEESWLGLDR